jgi:tetratricopeptide (TPR) repeat protein
VNIKTWTLALACALSLGIGTAPAQADEPAPASSPSATTTAASAPPAAESASTSPDFQNAMQAFYQQDWPKAIQTFSGIVEKDPNDTMSWFFLFDSYIKRNDLRSILYQLEQKAMQTDNKNAQALAQLGIGYVARYMKEPQTAILDEAQKTLEKALEIEKTNPVAHTGLGLVYYLRRMMPRAKGNFLEAIRANPNDLMALERIGEITMVDEKRPQEANQLFQELVSKAPQYPDGYWYVGSSYFDMGEYDKCVQFMKKVIELDPNGVTQGYRAPMLMGKAFLKLKDYPSAKEAFLLELKINPNSEEARYLLEQSQNPPGSAPSPRNNKKK